MNNLPAAAVLAAGLALAGYLVGDGIVRARQADRTVSVRGFAEREVAANLVLWPIVFTVTSDELGPLQARADEGVARVLAFLADDFPADQVSVSAPRVQDRAGQGMGGDGRRLDRYAAEGFVRQQAQTQLVDSLAWLSPVLALRRVSMALAGTDLAAYQRFLDQAEQHRYTLVQALNRLQAEQMTLAGDRSSRDDRISRAHWQGIAGFSHRAEAAAPRLARALPAAGVMGAWLVTLTAACAWAGRRLTRNLG